MKMLVTEDGYKFYQQPNGRWTDTQDGIDYDQSFSDLEDLDVNFEIFDFRR